MVFQVYMGVDRSLGSGSNEVVFDPKLDNLDDASYLVSTENWANAALIQDKSSTDGFTYYNSPDPYPTLPGNMNRRVVRVMMNGEDPADYTTTQWAELRDSYGRAALNKRKFINMIDGRLIGDGPYTYGFNYGLGDVVSIGQDPETSVKGRVIEYIWSHDNTGFTSYPTFRAI